MTRSGAIVALALLFCVCLAPAFIDATLPRALLQDEGKKTTGILRSSISRLTGAVAGAGASLRAATDGLGINGGGALRTASDGVASVTSRFGSIGDEKDDGMENGGMGKDDAEDGGDAEGEDDAEGGDDADSDTKAGKGGHDK
ncbi:hypothetical protein COO60DRAFT_1525004 [Scenedesmus sp. NREL 46B-D3]|nr:hypothetical protein COO60DRAFT_1525004 [Scenedesmus sp. NREL 46B-D3]